MEENKIAKQLKIFRNAKKLTAKEVSYYLKDNDCHVEARSIYEYEKGNRMPSVNVFLHLCHLYGCTDVLHEFGYGDIQAPNVADEMDVVNRYRKLSDEDKEIAKGFMDILYDVRNKQNQEDDEDIE